MDFIKFMIIDYDGTINWLGMFILIMLSATLVVLVLVVVETIHSSAEVNKFFDKYETEYGVVHGYEYNEEHTSTMIIPVIVGKTVVNTPRIIHHEAEYFISLKCKNQGVKFIATYMIPVSDYEVHNIKDTVKVEKYWTRYGYQVLEG